MIAFGAEVAGKLAEVENRDALLAELEKELTQAAAKYMRGGAELTAGAERGGEAAGEGGGGADQRAGDACEV